MNNQPRANSIAIIGMAGRFPGAPNLEQYWANIAGGVESISRFSDEELLLAGAPPEWLDRPDFVKAAPVLDGFDEFDAQFFKIARREAEIMDPQQRIMLELAQETLERAGYAGDHRGAIGVFTGAGGLMSSYLCSPQHFYSRLVGPTGSMHCVGNDKDYLSTRISYKLDLRGPSLTVQTACSTSLVAVHLACQSLLAGDCDMALAGGVTIRVPHRMGYLHSSQALLSPDGHCRAFDADAKGTVFGSGAGLVLLKPLPQAIADGDHIHAVIRGSAVTNDGAAKLSYWATNAEGQAAACAAALAVAEVDPRTIGYLEAHGTATTMGDPVEIFGLNKAFRRGTQDRQFCAIGSVKTNIGHLEAAAGVASLIKAVLALEHRTLPPSLHFRRANPAIDFAATPFFVNTQCREWEQDHGPRRAAVNSLGIGGTNAHVILEEIEVPKKESGAVFSKAAPGKRFLAPLLLPLSAKTPNALHELAGQFADYLGEHPDAELYDVCFTAGAGRGHHAHRLAIIASTPAEARDSLRKYLDPHTVNSNQRPTIAGEAEPANPQVVFLLGGEGEYHSTAGGQLHENQPVFRQAIERCREIIAKSGSGENDDTNLFALQFALGQLWKSWGIEPAALLGHGLGEYAAAALAGAMTPEAALELISLRRRLIDSMPADGAMLAALGEPRRAAEIAQAFAAEVAVAAMNGPRQTVYSGRSEAIAALAERLSREGIRARPLPGRHALYSPAMSPIVEEFRAACRKFEFRKPRARLIPAAKTSAEPFSADYWAEQIRCPIMFAEGIATLDRQGFRAFVELGPRPKLLGLGRRSMEQWAGAWLPSLRSGQGELETMLDSLAKLYVRGSKIDWAAVHRGRRCRRLTLPTYPFQRKRYWVEAMSLIKDEPRGEVRVLTIDTAQLVDSTAIEQCYREILAVLNRCEESFVLLDFSRVTFMSSMALGMLVRVNKRCKEFKAALRLCGIAPDIREVFKITGMDKIFDIHEDAAAALAAFKGGGGMFFRKTRPASYEVG
jgi:microcystin synthetase protein McyG